MLYRTLTEEIEIAFVALTLAATGDIVMHVAKDITRAAYGFILGQM